MKDLQETPSIVWKSLVCIYMYKWKFDLPESTLAELLNYNKLLLCIYAFYIFWCLVYIHMGMKYEVCCKMCVCVSVVATFNYYVVNERDVLFLHIILFVLLSSL